MDNFGLCYASSFLRGEMYWLSFCEEAPVLIPIEPSITYNHLSLGEVGSQVVKFAQTQWSQAECTERCRKSNQRELGATDRHMPQMEAKIKAYQTGRSASWR